MIKLKEMKVPEKLKKFVSNELFKSISVFVIPLLVSFITSYSVSVHASLLAAQLANQNKTISDFQTDARSVDASIAAYAYSVIDDGKPDETATQNLRQNLIEQYDEVDNVAPYVELKHRALIPAYKLQIVAMTKVIPNTTNVLNMKDFWETASKLLTLRNKITSSLPG